MPRTIMAATDRVIPVLTWQEEGQELLHPDQLLCLEHLHRQRLNLQHHQQVVLELAGLYLAEGGGNPPCSARRSERGEISSNG